jgi:hypothetical protein
MRPRAVLVTIDKITVLDKKPQIKILGVIMKKLNQNQLPLFQILDTSSLEEKVVYNGIPASQATFRAGLAARVHRWFRLTPSFGPDLVQDMLATLRFVPGEIVLDPFAGAATTMIECQLLGIASYGFEINPFLQWIGETSLNWDLEVPQLKQTLKLISDNYAEFEPRATIEALDSLNLKIPPIHDPLRWWRSDILAKLLLLKQSIDLYSPTSGVRAFFRLALAGVLVPDLTNVTLGRLQLHFIDRTGDVINVLEVFSAHCHKMIDDLEQIQRLHLTKTSKVFLINSTEPDPKTFPVQVNCVVTSPPYPNRYSYVWNTRPHLYFLDFFNDPKEASNLDKLTIGGTWGTATSVLSKGRVEAAQPIISDVVGPVVDQIRRSDNLMANYVMNYFNLLGKQIIEMEPFLASDARIAYVVGCSRVKSVFVETDILLGKIIQGLDLGYHVSKLERIRKRNSGKDLHESVVYASK